MIIFNKIIYLPLILCFLNNKLVSPINWLEENKTFDVDDKENIEAPVCPDEFQDFCSKKYSRVQDLIRLFFNKKYNSNELKNKRVPVSPSHPFNKGPCQCGMNFRLLDLGNHAYPRYFHTGVCKKNSCGIYHRCQPKKYKVQILKRKFAINDPALELSYNSESTFPESLQADWAPDYVNVVVGCDCLPKKM